MRTQSPWAARFAALALLGSLTTLPARAQWFTTDVPHIGVQLAEFTKKATDWLEHMKSFAVVRDAFAAAKAANEISTGISSITSEVRSLTNQGLALQQSIQADLKLVANIRNLKVSNMSDLKNLALNLSSLNLTNALPSLGQANRFTQALANGTDADALIVKESLGVLSTKPGVRLTAQDMRQQQKDAVMAQLALENKAQQDKITQAFQLKKTADELTASAVELQASTNTKDQLKMTDGERLASQASASGMLLQAQQYRIQANELIVSAAEKGPTQLAAERVIADEVQVAGLLAMHQAMHPNEDAPF